MRREYEMSEEDLEQLLEAAKPTPCIMIGGVMPRTPQEKANTAWAILGRKMGFKPMTVRPIPGKSNRFFSAEAATAAEGSDD